MPDLPGDVPAAYVFRVAFRLEPHSTRVEPSTFETTLSRPADPPGEEGWLFFRDNCWRGEANDEAHLREMTEAELGVTVQSVAFSELRATAGYLDALREAIAAELSAGTGAFGNAESVDAVLKQYLGSSIRVVD